MMGKKAFWTAAVLSPVLDVPRITGAPVASVFRGSSVLVNTMEEMGDHRESTDL
jgi:hypothetical protein